MTTYYFEGVYGLGDSIYQRPFLRHFPGTYVRTCWPELYRGLDVKCVRSGTHLRTQEKNELRSRYVFHPVPRGGIRKRIGYGPADLSTGGIIPAFRRQFGVNGPLQFDLPQFNDLHPCIPTDRPVAVIRSRCIKNFSRCNLDSVELACEMLFGEIGYSIEVIGPWHWEITTTGAVRFILFCAKSLDVLPRASGMAYTFVEN